VRFFIRAQQKLLAERLEVTMMSKSFSWGGDSSVLSGCEGGASMTMMMIWVVTTYELVGGGQSFGDTYCLRIFSYHSLLFVVL
jgi:hypothetical protein